MRYALRPTPERESLLLEFCAHARFVWNLAVEQQAWRKVTRTAKIVQRLEQKAPGRVERINPAYTGQTCSGCGTTDKDNRKSQAEFECASYGYSGNADVNAARNIAAGHAVRGARKSLASKREPQLCAA